MTTRVPNLAALLLLLLLTTVSSAAADANDESASLAPPPTVTSCSDKMVAMSPCLPVLAVAPNKGSTVPSAECCAKFVAAVGGSSNGAGCLCHLVREPYLLGFPVNGSRLSSLFPACGRSSADAASFEEVCRGSQALQPFRSTEGVEIRAPTSSREVPLVQDSPAGDKPPNSSLSASSVKSPLNEPSSALWAHEPAVGFWGTRSLSTLFFWVSIIYS